MDVASTIRLAPESKQVRIAREKLRQRGAEEDQCITSEALEQKVEEIHKRIADNQGDRVPVEGKMSLSLFDGGQHVAGLSRKVQALADQLRRGLSGG